MAKGLASRVPPRRGADIDEIARQTLIRAFLYMPNAFQPHAFINFFDGGGLTALGFNYDVLPLPHGEKGKYDPTDNCIVLSEITYEGLLDDKPNARFTLAHELGYGILHGEFLREPLGGRTPQPIFKLTSLRACRDPEWQANRFATAFLMPTPIIRKCIREGMNDIAIARYFRVSVAVLQDRIKELKKQGIL